jgi:hypothetical protein
MAGHARIGKKTKPGALPICLVNARLPIRETPLSDDHDGELVQGGRILQCAVEEYGLSCSSIFDLSPTTTTVILLGRR